MGRRGFGQGYCFPAPLARRAKQADRGAAGSLRGRPAVPPGCPAPSGPATRGGLSAASAAKRRRARHRQPWDAPRLLSRAGGGPLRGAARRLRAGSPLPPFPFPPLGGGGPRGCFPARRGAGARCVTWSSAAALPVRASSNGSAPAGPRRPISWRLVPLPRSFSERIRRRSGKLPVRARLSVTSRAQPAPQPRRSPHARGRGLYLSYLGGWLRSRERGGRKAELPVALVLPSQAFTHLHLHRPESPVPPGRRRHREKGRVHWIKHVTRDGQVSDRRHAAAPAARGWPARLAGCVSPLSGGGRGPAGTAFLPP